MAAFGRRRPPATDTPSDVPSTFDSMSWVAKPLPANSTSIQPPRTRRAIAGPAPVWIDGRAADGEHLRAGLLGRPDPSGHVGDEQRLGLLATTPRSS